MMRDPEARVRNVGNATWSCGCGGSITPLYAAAVAASARVALERDTLQSETVPVVPLYCPACGCFVGWTAAPMTQAQLHKRHRERWITSLKRYAPIYLATAVVERLEALASRLERRMWDDDDDDDDDEL